MSNHSSHAHPVLSDIAQRTAQKTKGHAVSFTGMSVQKRQFASLFGGCALGILLGLPLTHLRPEAPPSGTIVLAMGETVFDVPAALVKNGKAEASGQRLDLALNGDDFGPANPSTGNGTVWMTVIPAGSSVAPELWPSTIYARYVTAEVEQTETGLIRRKFRDGTPYSGETLYLGELAEKPFMARCSVEAGKNTCLSTFRRGTIDIMLRFGEERLGDWRALIEHADDLLQKTRRRGLA